MPMLFSFVVLIAMVFALVDIITRDTWLVKHLPKFAWVLLVIFIPFVGTILWFAIGREYPASVSRPRMSWGADAAPARPVPSDTRSTEQQLADLEREVEYERMRAELEALKRQDRSELSE
ncbi:PLD nuclease N-terminal domain-containing protein [Leifsonia sp. YIM 134122]|uniref:PLD nuclease N-terminal domain-containing protein n=1 Tax=Leifsonia stereocauli TaxID=3134136 RepID=A0ABU9W666_9MICO